MPAKGLIYDPTNQLSSKIDNGDGAEKEGLVVATRPLKTFENETLFFFNPTHGIDMNKSPGAAGTPVNIHNGIDDVYWTASAITGALRWDFNSSTEAHTGSYSIDGSSTINGDESQYAKGSNQDLTGYTSLVGWIYITGWALTGTKEVQIYGWDVGVGIVGNIVNIGDYVDPTIFNVWQKFTIPLSALGLTEETIDSIRAKTVSLGAGAAPSYYLDDVQIQETGAPIEYTVEPAEGTWLYVNLMNIVMADALDSTLLNASMSNLSYDKFLGATLTEGLTFQAWEHGEPIWSIKIFNILDFLSFPNKNIVNDGCDGVNTWLNLNLESPYPDVMKSENQGKYVMSVADDLDALLYFRISLSCRLERR